MNRHTPTVTGSPLHDKRSMFETVAGLSTFFARRSSRPPGVESVRSRHSALLFVGDLTWPGREAPAVLLAPNLRASVGLVPNLEGPLLGCGSEWRLRPGATCGLWNGPGTRDLLAAMQTELVGGANNHLTDFRHGARATAAELRQRGIAIGGVGESRDEARRPVLISLADGAQVLVLFLGDRRVGCIPPGPGRPGVNAMSERASRVWVERLRAAFPDAIVVVSVHAGEELQPHPTPYVRTWFRELAAAGADVVVGHHPHLPHGAEKLGRSWIFHSLGNFLMAARDYVGVSLGYSQASSSSIGVSVSRDGVSVIRISADPEAGSVRQDGDAFKPELLLGAETVEDAEYAAWYRERRTVSWWYPLWTGRESAVAAFTKTCLLRAVFIARHLVVRARAPRRTMRTLRLPSRAVSRSLK